MDIRTLLKLGFIGLLGGSAGPLTRLYEKFRDVEADPRAVILTYHKVTELDLGLDSFWSVSPGLFRKHIEYLKRNGFQVISLARWLRHRVQGTRLPPKSVIITFDDGYASFYRHAFPVLQEYGFPATLFLASAHLGNHNLYWWDRLLLESRSVHQDELRTLNWSELADLKSSGLIDFGSHTVTHPPHLGRLERNEIDYEVRHSKEFLEDRLKRPISHFAYPGGIRRYGDISEETRLAIERAGYLLAVTSEMGRSSLQDDIFQLKRIGINRKDSVPLFEAKLVGALDWLNGAQALFQRTFNNIW